MTSIIKISGRFLCSIATTSLMACSASPDTMLRNSNDYDKYHCDANFGIGEIKPGSKYEYWHILIRKDGKAIWNGQDVDKNTLRRYMLELSRMPEDAGKLTIHVQPGISCDEINDFIRIFNTSELCKKERCVRDKWDYDEPIVN